MDSEWVKRRWFDLRQGHTFYLIYTLTGANFILIFHRLLIERVPALNDLFSNLWLFAIIFVILYIPIAITIGAWHRKSQIKIDSEQQMRRNPVMAKMFRTVIDIQTGKASEEEIRKFREFLISIEQGRGGND